MKLKTKFQDEDFELGEVVDVTIATRASGGVTLQGKAKAGGYITIHYKSLKELYDNWEDYEEPKEYWYVGYKNIVRNAECVFHSDYADNDITEKRKEIGNYFKTKEEAERAVEKLKAWKRLRDNGFKFNGYFHTQTRTYTGYIFLKSETPYSSYDDIDKDLDLLFGGEE